MNRADIKRRPLAADFTGPPKRGPPTRVIRLTHFLQLKILHRCPSYHEVLTDSLPTGIAFLPPAPTNARLDYWSDIATIESLKLLDNYENSGALNYKQIVSLD